jgi:hypothetical protein
VLPAVGTDEVRTTLNSLHRFRQAKNFLKEEGK